MNLGYRNRRRIRDTEIRFSKISRDFKQSRALATLDTFRVTWRDPYLGRDYLGFVLDRMGRIDAVDVEGFGRFDRVRRP